MMEFHTKFSYIYIYIHIYIHTCIHASLMSGSQSAGRIKAIFAEIDRDNSGTIDRDEFAKAMEILRVDLTSREIQAVGAVVVMILFRVSKWITVAVSCL